MRMLAPQELQLVAGEVDDHEAPARAQDPRRLGFTDAEMHGWFNLAGMAVEPPVRLAGDPLTVVVWPARRAAVSGVDEDSAEPLERSAVA